MGSSGFFRLVSGTEEEQRREDEDDVIGGASITVDPFRYFHTFRSLAFAAKASDQS